MLLTDNPRSAIVLNYMTLTVLSIAQDLCTAGNTG